MLPMIKIHGFFKFFGFAILAFAKVNSLSATKRSESHCFGHQSGKDVMLIPIIECPATFRSFFTLSFFGQ